MMSSQPNIWNAIDNDDPESIKNIVSQGQSLDKLGFTSGKTPLQYALEKRKRYAFKALLENGADPDFFLSTKQTVTFECALLEDSYWLRQVIAHGADPNLWTKTHRNNAATPLAATFCYTSGSARSVENAKLLIDAGADLNATICGSHKPLSLFAMRDGWAVVLYLLEKGADPTTGPKSSLFFYHLRSPSEYLQKNPDFQSVQMKLKEMNLDIPNAKWNGQGWDIPKLSEQR